MSRLLSTGGASGTHILWFRSFINGLPAAARSAGPHDGAGRRRRSSLRAAGHFPKTMRQHRWTRRLRKSGGTVCLLISWIATFADASQAGWKRRKLVEK